MFGYAPAVLQYTATNRTKRSDTDKRLIADGGVPRERLAQLQAGDEICVNVARVGTDVKTVEVLGTDPDVADADLRCRIPSDRGTGAVILPSYEQVVEIVSMAGDEPAVRADGGGSA